MPSFVLVKRATLFAALPLCLVLASTARAYGPNGEEDRCTELGANCLCGEPHNTTSYVNTDPPNKQFWDDPTTTGSKQCAPPGRAALFSGRLGEDINPLIVAEANLVSGGYGDRLPQGTAVHHVLRMGLNGGFAFMDGLETGAGVRRMCMRSYFMRDRRSQLRGVKDMELCHGASGPGFQNIFGDGARQPNMYWMNIGNVPCNNNDGSTYSNSRCTGIGNLLQTHTIGHWVRAEFCTYGALTGSGNVFVEGYIQRLDDPSIRRDWAPIPYGDVPHDGTGGCLGNKIWSAVGGDISPGYQKLVSHSMQAGWPTDSPGVFIGPAYEIEGRNGTPPPPRVSPPVPPELLP